MYVCMYVCMLDFSHTYTITSRKHCGEVASKVLLSVCSAHIHTTLSLPIYIVHISRKPPPPGGFLLAGEELKSGFLHRI